jgi:hypothetical protein
MCPMVGSITGPVAHLQSPTALLAPIHHRLALSVKVACLIPPHCRLRASPSHVQFEDLVVVHIMKTLILRIMDVGNSRLTSFAGVLMEWENPAWLTV